MLCFTVNEDYSLSGQTSGTLSLTASEEFCARISIIDDFTLETVETIRVSFEPVMAPSMIPDSVTIVEQGLGGEFMIIIGDDEGNSS